MKVTLRERKKGDKISLYLDYYYQGKRKIEHLKLYLEERPTTRAQREMNAKIRQLAEAIRAKRLIEIQSSSHGFLDLEKGKANLVVFLEQQVERRGKSEGNHGNWKSMIKHLKKYAPRGIRFEAVDVRFVEGFKEYLDNEAIGHNNMPLSENSKYSYFNKFRAGLKQAVREGILSKNPAESVPTFKQAETQREFLTLEELQALAKTEFELPVMKRAFIFSCLSGIRWGDIHKMVWSEVQHSSELGYYIRFRQKKTKGAETQPISEQAYQLLGDRRGGDAKVFDGLRYSAWNNVKFRQWVMRAGITKPITFHCGRHTYATLQLTFGTDIFTVSKLLGHKELKTTLIYAKVIDIKKKEAASKIQIDLES